MPHDNALSLVDLLRQIGYETTVEEVRGWSKEARDDARGWAELQLRAATDPSAGTALVEVPAAVAALRKVERAATS